MRSALAILLYVLTLPATGHAGAWMRENGESFLSVSVALRHSAIGTGREVDVYFDHGFAPRLSGGLAVFEDSGRSGHVMGFLRFPCRPGTVRIWGWNWRSGSITNRAQSALSTR